MKLPGLAAFAFTILLAGALQAQAPTPEIAAQGAAESWLKLVDTDKFTESWTAAAAAFQKLVAQDQWTKAIAAVRAPMGKLVNRKLKSAQFTRTLPGAPDGEYVILQFDAEFEHKKAALETVTPLKDTDGSWKVSGYYIK